MFKKASLNHYESIGEKKFRIFKNGLQYLKNEISNSIRKKTKSIADELISTPTNINICEGFLKQQSETVLNTICTDLITLRQKIADIQIIEYWIKLNEQKQIDNITIIDLAHSCIYASPIRGHISMEFEKFIREIRFKENAPQFSAKLKTFITKYKRINK